MASVKKSLIRSAAVLLALFWVMRVLRQTFKRSLTVFWARFGSASFLTASVTVRQCSFFPSLAIFIVTIFALFLRYRFNILIRSFVFHLFLRFFLRFLRQHLDSISVFHPFSLFARFIFVNIFYSCFQAFCRIRRLASSCCSPTLSFVPRGLTPCVREYLEA